jgi:transposase-like protein
MKQQRNCRGEEAEMSKVKSATNCPECNTRGVLVGKRGLFLKLKCSSCKYKWQTLFVVKKGVMKT